MGVYIYSIRARSIKMEINGNVENVHMFQYLTKPWYTGFLGGEDSGTRLLKGRCDHYWGDKGGTPEFIVCPSGDHPKRPQVMDGDPVFRWNERFIGWDYDTPCFKRATHIGWVFKKGRKYEFHTEKYSYSSGHMKRVCFYVKDGGTFLTKEEADAWIQEQMRQGRHVSGGRTYFENGERKHTHEVYKEPFSMGTKKERLVQLTALGDASAAAELNRIREREGL
ncbi:MAG: hypothetical protein GF334_02650 [Candidatus Altiarchaeales archaeon]|nr:hypothetical protein [Candidatus Altiarchaeales archaeon]